MFERNELLECFFEEPQSYNIDMDQNDYLNDINCSPLTSINTDQFLDYFMKIDYKTDFFRNNDPSDKEKGKNINESSTTNSSLTEQSNLNRKKARDDNSPKSGVIIDELTNQVYKEKDDPIEYRKAKKRIQNRESALRLRQMKKQNTQLMEDEITQLKNDNSRLYKDNNILKKEKNFLIEQIKYMQSLLKASKKTFSEDCHTSPTINHDVENNDELPRSSSTSSSEGYYYNGLKQKKGRLFNIMLICFLGIAYLGMEYSSSGTQQITFHSKEMSLNSVKDSNSQGICGIITKLLLVLIGVLIVPMINQTKTIRDYFDRGIRKKLM